MGRARDAVPESLYLFWLPINKSRQLYNLGTLFLKKEKVQISPVSLGCQCPAFLPCCY